MDWNGREPRRRSARNLFASRLRLGKYGGRHSIERYHLESNFSERIVHDLALFLNEKPVSHGMPVRSSHGEFGADDCIGRKRSLSGCLENCGFVAIGERAFEYFFRFSRDRSAPDLIVCRRKGPSLIGPATPQHLTEIFEKRR